MISAAQNVLIEQVRERIEHLGVAGARGERLALLERRAQVVIGRVCDDEPLVATETVLAASQPDRIVRGLGCAGLLCGAERLILAVNRRARQAVERLCRETAGTRIEIVLIEPRVPLGERSLLCDLAALATAESAPLSFGVDGAAVIGAATLCDLALALEGRAPLRRTVTVAGEVREPAVLRVPLGASIADLVAACGGSPDFGWRAFHNGVLRGTLVDGGRAVDLDTFAVTVLPHDHPLLERRAVPLGDELRRAAAACVRCRVCSDCCPVRLDGGRLNPQSVIQALAAGGAETEGPLAGEAEVDVVAALECDGCGVCAALCPAGLRPDRLVTAAAERLREQGFSLAEAPRLAPLPERQGRRLDIDLVVERLGLASYRRQLELRPAAVLPARITIAPVGPGGDPRLPAVQAGERVAEGDIILLAAAGAQAPDVRAPARGTVVAVDPDDGVTLELA